MGQGLLKAQGFRRLDGVLHCDDLPVTEAVARWGTPLYLYSGSEIRGRYQELDVALDSVPHLIAYSAKANGNLSVLRMLGQMGAGVDIVSGGELVRALHAGVPPERIVFSGVGKTVPELAAALEAGIYGFNVESEGELRALADLGAAVGARAPIALRVNPDVEAATPHAYTRTGHAASKFGIPIADARRLYAYAADAAGLEVRGVDVHIGSQILDVEPYRRTLVEVLRLVDELQARGHALEYLDLGGGLGISYTGDEGISAVDFAAAVVPEVASTGLKLVVEPGRYIVGAAGILLTRVLYLKEGGGKRFVITDAGMNDLLRPSHYSGYHEVEAVESRERPRARVDVVGPICETGDFLALDREMEVPEPGELLAIMTVGAYGFSMSSTYNQRPRPAEVMVEGSDAILIRRRETPEDLMAAEIGL